MSSREKILQAVKDNKPLTTPLPELNLLEVISYVDLVTQFKRVLESIGGTWLDARNKEDVKNLIAVEMGFSKNSINTLDGYDESLPGLNAEELANVDIAVIRGGYAVAENGAIWINEEQMVNRLLPFITQHLVIVIEEKNIVATMHHVYLSINVNETGFGVFIAGPSKTADIEQSLVIGAHGPVTFKVLIVKQ